MYKPEYIKQKKLLRICIRKKGIHCYSPNPFASAIQVSFLLSVPTPTQGANLKRLMQEQLLHCNPSEHMLVLHEFTR